MYITCPECKSNFVVTPEQLGSKGRKVKCSKCQNTWFAQPGKKTLKIEPTLTISEDISDSDEIGVNLPALVPIKIPFYLLISPIFLLLLMILISYIFLGGGSDIITNNSSFQGVAINDINIERKAEINKMIVKYKIINNTEQDRQIPLVRIRLLDKDNRVLQTHTEKPSVNLKPKQFVSIKTEFNAIPPSAKEIDITLGNKFNFLLR